MQSDFDLIQWGFEEISLCVAFLLANDHIKLLRLDLIFKFCPYLIQKKLYTRVPLCHVYLDITINLDLVKFGARYKFRSYDPFLLHSWTAFQILLSRTNSELCLHVSF